MTDVDIAVKMAEALGDDALSRVLGEIALVLRQLDWAEEEMSHAQELHPDDADVLYHAVGLLVPTHSRMTAEFVYRSHCRELLGRAGRGEDTRPATWAEIACACSEASMVAPMTDTGFGTYARAWNEAQFPMTFPDMSDTLKHVEGLHGPEIDDMISQLRRKLSVKTRTLKGTACEGTHFGEPALQCRYRTQDANSEAA